MTATQTSAGSLIREWRTRRRMSQLDLAMEAEISQRHLSFVESGRAAPSRDMVLHLAEQLSIPLRQRNQLLLAAGFAPSFSERPLTDASLAPAMAAVEIVLKGTNPSQLWLSTGTGTWCRRTPPSARSWPMSPSFPC